MPKVLPALHNEPPQSMGAGGLGGAPPDGPQAHKDKPPLDVHDEMHALGEHWHAAGAELSVHSKRGRAGQQPRRE